MRAATRPALWAATLIVTLGFGLSACSSDSDAENIAEDACELLEDTDFEVMFAEAMEAAFSEEGEPTSGALADFEKRSEEIDERTEEAGLSEDEIAEAMKKECADTYAEWEAFGEGFEDTDASEDGAAEDVAADDSSSGPVTLPDTPQAHAHLTVLGDESALPVGTDGELSVAAMGTAGKEDASIPVLVQNLSDEPVSNLRVSGRGVDADGNVVGSGSSQGFEPNVVEPGDYAIGYVYIDTNDLYLPKGTTVEDVSIDSTPGLSDSENRVAVDVEDVEQLANGAITGDLVNPHDITVSGPIGVAALCIGPKGDLTHLSDYADREELAAGSSSTFTLTTYGSKPECNVTLIGASGYEG